MYFSHFFLKGVITNFSFPLSVFAFWNLDSLTDFLVWHVYFCILIYIFQYKLAQSSGPMLGVDSKQGPHSESNSSMSMNG